MPECPVWDTCISFVGHLHGSRATQVWLVFDTSVARTSCKRGIFQTFRCLFSAMRACSSQVRMRSL